MTRHAAGRRAVARTWCLAACLALSALTASAGAAVRRFELHLVPSLGMREVADPGEMEVGLELLAPHLLGKVDAIGGFSVTARETLYGYLGFQRDFRVGRSRWSLVPSLAAGAYSQGEGRSLAGSLQFRSALELAWRRRDGVQVGLRYAHLSNADIHPPNPGTESLVLLVRGPFRIR